MLNQKNFLWLGTLLAFLLLCYALYSQHINGFEPCVRCIYQRLALIGVLLGGVISLSHYWLRPVGLIIVFVCAFLGLSEANTHIGVMDGTVSDFCPFRPNFGFLGRLDKLIPWLLEGPGDCIDDSWKMLGFTMPQWVWFICINFLIGSAILFFTFLMSVKKHLAR
jgi:disulfide bond formation protein DsbB